MVPDGSIRVLDLGIAKTLRANRALTVNFWASAPYASPERLEDGNVRLGDDLWAVGVMLFEMACREHPYQAYMVDDNNAALARAIRRSEPQGAHPSRLRRAPGRDHPQDARAAALASVSDRR